MECPNCGSLTQDHDCVLILKAEIERLQEALKATEAAAEDARQKNAKLLEAVHRMAAV